jgi:hypothetical protein
LEPMMVVPVCSSALYGRQLVMPAKNALTFWSTAGAG